MCVSVVLICAWRRSSLMLPNHVRNEFSAGTVQGPERLTSPTPRTPAGCVAMPTAALAGRSEVSGARSERITALAAASMRSVNSSSVSRPSVAASRRRFTVASRSASEARTSIRRHCRARTSVDGDEALVGPLPRERDSTRLAPLDHLRQRQRSRAGWRSDAHARARRAFQALAGVCRHLTDAAITGRLPPAHPAAFPGGRPASARAAVSPSARGSKAAARPRRTPVTIAPRGRRARRLRARRLYSFPGTPEGWSRARAAGAPDRRASARRYPWVIESIESRRGRQRTAVQLAQAVAAGRGISEALRHLNAHGTEPEGAIVADALARFLVARCESRHAGWRVLRQVVVDSAADAPWEKCARRAIPAVSEDLLRISAEDGRIRLVRAQHAAAERRAEQIAGHVDQAAVLADLGLDTGVVGAERWADALSSAVSARSREQVARAVDLALRG